MHKKPIYSFENKTSTGVDQVPLLSIMHIEDTAGLELVDDNFSNLGGDPALVIVLAKNNIPTNNILEFIADDTNWMWFYNGDLIGHYVRIIGDTMSGTLTVDNNLDSTNPAHIKLINGSNLYAEGQLNVGGNNGVITYANTPTGGVPTWYIDAPTNDAIVRIDNERVLTEITGVEFHDYATPTIGGIIKARRVGNILYMTTNGSNA